MDTLKDALNVISRIEKDWILILDNADDPDFDYGHFFPPGSKGAILLNSRNPECEGHQTVGCRKLEALDPEDAVDLLLKASKVSKSSRLSMTPAARQIVDLLSSHTLALTQAGAFVANGYCSLPEYPSTYEEERKRLLQFRPRQAQSRYGDVYATFEASARVLEASQDHHVQLALFILGTFSMLNYTNLPIRVFAEAWEGSRGVLADTSDDKDSNLDKLSNAHVGQVSSFLPVHSAKWNRFDFHHSLELLSSLALIKQSSIGENEKAVSIHPLAHAWVKDRMDDESQVRTWLRTGSFIALSAHKVVWEPWTSVWRLLESPLRPHITSFIGNGEDYSTSDNPIGVLVQIQYRCAWILYHMRLDQELDSYLSRLYERLGERPQPPTKELLPLAKIKARNLGALGDMSASLQMWEQINILESALPESDWRRLVSQHELGTAYLQNCQVRQAIDVLERVVQAKQAILAHSHPDLMTSVHELARAYVEDDRVLDAIGRFEHVVSVSENLLPPTHQDLLISRHELARSYLLNGQVRKAVKGFEYIVHVSKDVLPPNHPNLLITKRQLARAYQASGRLDDAIDLLEFVADAQSKTLPNGNTSFLQTKSWLSEAYFRDRQIEKAITVLENVLSSRKQVSQEHESSIREEEEKLVKMRAELHKKQTLDD